MTTTRQRQDKMNYESKLNVQPKDPSKKHFYLSMVKSAIRLGGCMVLALSGNLVLATFAVMFAIAEFIGIAEEL